jgi:hypothetical protein
MSPVDPLVRRVARCHQAAVVLRDVPVETVEVIYSDGGIVSARDIARLLEERFGVLVRVRFHPSLSGTPNTVAWKALDGQGEIDTGRLILHAGVRQDQVVSWAEVVVDNGAPNRTAGAGRPEEQLLRARLERIEGLARRMIQEARVNPQKPAFAVVEDLVRIVDEAAVD